MSRQPPAGVRVTYSRQYRRCNKPDCPACRAGGSGHGPYWYATWRQDGKRYTSYVGRELPAEAAAAAEAPAVLEPARESAAAAAASSTSTESYPALRVRTLGGFAVWRGPEPIGVAAWRQGKVGALFKCLLGAPNFRLHREVLADWLWPDAEPEAGAATLRQTLFRLRRALSDGAAGAGYVRMDGEMLTLVPAPNGAAPPDWLDAAAFDAAATAALQSENPRLCRAALTLYAGEYLPDDRYADWAVARREELHQLSIAVLLHLAALREQHGVLGEASRSLRTVLTLDPCHEPAARALMRVQSAAGHHAEAVKTYQRVAEALQRELGVQPDAATAAAYHAVLATRTAAVARHGNLPTPLTSFLGREHEIEALSRLLREVSADRNRVPGRRLVTITGLGGAGKTRLAIELGHELRAHYADGVWLVELAALAATNDPNPELIARHACAALDLRLEPDRQALETLQSWLAVRQLLLIVDNCEHLVPAGAAFAAGLLSRCANLQVVTTSRESLGVLGEVSWPLAPLAVPGGRHGTVAPAPPPGQYAGVRLFLDRAASARPGFALTPDTNQSVVAICRRLDGIPLAIELAAARLAQLSVEDLAARLDDRFRLLISGNRTALPRHQTLRAVLDWSYSLLGPGEQAVIRALSVFSGGWTLEAAEQVCAGPLVPPADVLDLHGRLIAKSLLILEDSDTAGSGTRYQMLETVRQYAEEKLDEVGERAAAADRHLGRLVIQAKQLEPELRGPRGPALIALLDLELDNLRAAIRWSLRSDGDVESGLQLAVRLFHFMHRRGYWREARDWLVPLLARAQSGTVLQLDGLNALGWYAEELGDFQLARTVSEEMLKQARHLGNRRQIAGALNHLASLDSQSGAFAAAAARWEDVLEIRRAENNTRDTAGALHNLGLGAYYLGDVQRAILLLEECLQMILELGDTQEYAWSLANLIEVVQYAGDPARYQALTDELLRRSTELHDRWGVATYHEHRGRIACAAGRVAEAVQHLCLAAPALRELGYAVGLPTLLEEWAVCAAASQDLTVAARWLGAASAARTHLGKVLVPLRAAEITRVTDQLRAGLTPEAFADAWAAGAALNIDRALDEAMAWTPSGHAGPPR